jgi:hypothetical protein
LGLIARLRVVVIAVVVIVVAEWALASVIPELIG